MEITARSDDALTSPEPIRDYSRLSRTEEALILRLADDGKTQTQIAHALNCSQSTVSRVLRDFTDTRELAKRRLHSGAEQLAKRVLMKANVEESLEVLDRIGVAEKRHTGNAPAIQVVVGLQVGTHAG